MTLPEPEVVRGSAGMSAAAAASPSALWARRAPGFVYRAFEATDLFSGLLALCGALLLLNLDDLPGGVEQFFAWRIRVDKILLLGVFAACWNGVFGWLGLYRRSGIGPPAEELVRIAAACSLGTVPTLLFWGFSATGSFTLGAVLLFWAISIGAVIGTRATMRVLTAFISGQAPRQVLIVGSGRRAQMLGHALCGRNGSGTQLVGFVDTSNAVTDHLVRERWLGTLDDLEDVLMRMVVDEVLIALPIRSRYQQIQDAIHTCERLGIQSTYLADIFQPSLGRVRYEEAHPFPIQTVMVVRDDFRLAIKRAMDIVGAVVGLVLLAPLLLLIAAVIGATSHGPVLFGQQRFGRNKRLFRMYKFRTMVPDAEALHAGLEERNEAQGPVFKIAEDPRVTWVGRFLRRRSLDELPQLWNVLKGEMSLVGPRPLPIRDVARFDKGWLMRRFSMPPGLTCLWQISGRSNVEFGAWVELDLKYIDNWSLRLDCLILLKTIPAVLKGTGAH